MATIPFALSIHKFVNSVGNDVGFASIIAVAILILLYFAHARETATLRSRLDEAQARIGGLEQRVAQLLHGQAVAPRGRVPGPIAPVPVAPPLARPMGSAAASVRRAPSPATAAAAAASAPAATMVVTSAAPAVRGPAYPGPSAPVGVAGPALASATKLIPDAEGPAPVRAPDDTVFVPPKPATAGTNGHGGTPPPTPALPPTDATQAIPAAAAAAVRTAGASPRGGAPVPPRVQMATEPATMAGTGAPAGAGPRRAASIPRPPALTGLVPPAKARGRLAGRVLPLVIGGIAVIVIIVGLVVITSTGGSTTASVSHNNGSAGQTGASLVKQHHAAPPFQPSKFKVAVLNGTAVSGLAGDVSVKLAGDGFVKGNTTNAATQTQTATIIYYLPGATEAANKTAAEHVAKALSLAPASVRRATQASIQSCSVNPSGSPLNACDAAVIVSLGADRASLASGATSG